MSPQCLVYLILYRISQQNSYLYYIFTPCRWPQLKNFLTPQSSWGCVGPTPKGGPPTREKCKRMDHTIYGHGVGGSPLEWLTLLDGQK